jgi:hypothetical protein
MKRIFILIFLIVFECSCALDNLQGNSSLNIGVDSLHPQLIINSDNFNDFKEQSETTKKLLFNQVIELADDFVKRSIPEFQNANNSYREIGDGMPSLGLAFQFTEDKKYIKSAESWIEAMLNTESWEGSQNLGRSAWVMGLTFIYDWMYNALDKNLKEQLINRLISETEIIIETASFTRALSNHLLIETSAIGIVGLVLEDENPKKQIFLDQANEWTRYIIDHAPTDGSWGEGVQYWQYGTGYFLRFLEAAFTSGYKNYFEDYEWLKLTGYFPIYFSMPENLTRVVNFSDCGTDRYLPAFLLYLPAKKYRNEYFQDFGEKIQSDFAHKFSWLDFLFYDETLPAKNFTALSNFKHFEDHGFVTMRSGWDKGSTVIGFRCGPAPGHRNQRNPKRIENGGFGPGHQHPDINNFCIYSQNEWLIIDPGYARIKETRNYNTLLINGFGQAGAGLKWLDFKEFESREPVPKIVYTENNESYDYVIGDAGNIYVDEAGVDFFRRHLVFLKPDVVVVLDDVQLKIQSSVEDLFQLNEIAVAEKIDNAFKVKKNNVVFWVQAVLPDNCKTKILERTVHANDVHGLPNHEEGLLKTLNINAEIKKTKFLTVINILENENNIPPKINFQNDTLTIDNNGHKRVLMYLPDVIDENLPILQVIKAN